MTTGKPPCPTAEDALAQAVTAAAETLPEGGVLAEADFGRFTDPESGWWWRLKISREVTSEHRHLAQGGDTLERRTRLVIESWKRRFIYYEQDFTRAEDQ